MPLRVPRYISRISGHIFTPSFGTSSTISSRARQRTRGSVAGIRRASDFPLGILVALQGQHRDAGAVDAFYLHGGAFCLYGVAGLGGASEGAEDVATYGVEILVGQVEFETVVYVGYGDAAGDGEEVVADLLDGGLALVELVLDLPHYLLDDVLYRDKPLDAPPFVYDDGHLQLTGLELFEDILDALVLGYDQALPDNGPYVEILGVSAGGPEQVLDVDGAEDVVEVFLVDGIARVAPVDGDVDQLGERGVAGDGLDVGSRDHDLPRHPVAEVEDVVQVVALLGVEHSGGGRGGDHDPQLLLGVGLHLFPQPDAPGPENEVGRGVHDPDHGVEEELEHIQRTADPERYALGLLNGEVLGRLLPEDEMRVGYGRETEYDGDDRDYPLVRNTCCLEQGTYEVRDGGLADPTKRQGGNRNPDLADGEIRVEVAQSLAYDGGPRTAFLLELHDARLPHAHQRELGRHEETVQAHQHEGQKEVEPG